MGFKYVIRAWTYQEEQINLIPFADNASTAGSTSHDPAPGLATGAGELIVSSALLDLRPSCRAHFFIKTMAAPDGCYYYSMKEE